MRNFRTDIKKCFSFFNKNTLSLESRLVSSLMQQDWHLLRLYILDIMLYICRVFARRLAALLTAVVHFSFLALPISRLAFRLPQLKIGAAHMVCVVRLLCMRVCALVLRFHNSEIHF